MSHLSTDADSYADSYAYCYSNSYDYSDTHAYCYGDRNCDGNSDCYAYCYGDCEAHSDTEVKPAPETPANSSAAPLALLRGVPEREARFCEKSFLLLSRARERNYHFISARLT